MSGIRPPSRLSELPTYSEVTASRLQSLYSDLARQKSSNPASFHANVDWWRRTLESLVIRGWQSDTADILVLHASPDLVNQMRYDGVGKPLGLAAAITELRATQALIPLNSFCEANYSIYESTSLPYRVASFVVGKPLWWALQHAGLVNADSPSTGSTAAWEKIKGPYVVLRNVEHAADVILQQHRAKAGTSPADALYNFESFRRAFGSKGAVFPHVTFSDTDLRVLIKFLSRDRKALVSDKEVIKFVGDATEETITVIDRGILELKTGVENLEAQVDDIQRKIKERIDKINVALREKRKEVAMTHLRSRKQLEEILSKRLGSLEVLQITLLQVETAAGDVDIMKSYESSTATLRAILSHPSLQRDKVEATMDAMASASADQREIDDTIRTAMGAADDIDENELEAELRALVEDVKKEEKQCQDERKAEAVKLPAVPHGSPKMERARLESPVPPSETRTNESLSSPPFAVRDPDNTPSVDDGDKGDVEWESQWQNAQAEKAAQALHGQQAESARRAKWEDEDVRRLHIGREAAA